MRVDCDVNGDRRRLSVEPRTLLLDALRAGLGLTGTHGGCEQGACGACTVLLDGVAVRSCLMFAAQAEGREITTIEGIGEPGVLHPVQQALSEHHGLQCGFCTPGVVISTVALLEENPEPTRAEIASALSGNLCRCTGYAGILDAVELLSAGASGEQSKESEVPTS